MTIRFPYGLADFQKIREENYFYIDRTDRIPLIEQAGDQLLFLRPRRFGKSLWLSVLENYYDLARADRFEELFGDLKIGRNPTPKRNSYFVLRLNFSEVDPNGDTDAITASLHRHINSCVRGFNRYYHHHLPQPIERDTADSFVSLRDLIDVVAATGHKLYLIIDEYDNFANEVMASQMRGIDRYQELVGGEGVIKLFFKTVKASAEGRGLDRVFITGVSPVVMSDITSGYNVVKVVTHLDEYHDLCGFTHQEMDDILAATLRECSDEWRRMARREEILSMLRTFYNYGRLSETSHASSKFLYRGFAYSAWESARSAVGKQKGTTQYSNQRYLAGLFRVARWQRPRCRDRELPQGVRDERNTTHPSRRNPAGGIHEAIRAQPEPAGQGTERIAAQDQRDRAWQARHHGRHGPSARALLR
uniref:Predicted AAA-ATPase n=1 Tax=Candidatus Kentrum sp. SD TaxID=2126332 RepID=A0A451BQY9_9GAMM|nr:MAG: Predicted AAA-ATPase [Candidatus Kentron sp. SD]